MRTHEAASNAIVAVLWHKVDKRQLIVTGYKASVGQNANAKSPED